MGAFPASATESTTNIPAKEATTPAKVSDDAIRDQGVRRHPGADSGTNQAFTTPWAAFSDAVQPPGAHRVVVGQDGKPVHRFSMMPVVTNLPALTNSLEQLEAKSAAMAGEIRDAEGRETKLRMSIKDGVGKLMVLSTNGPTADDEEKQLRERVAELQSQLKEAGEKLQRKIEAGPEYQKLKAQLDADRKEFVEMRQRATDLIKQRDAVVGAILQRKRLAAQALQKEAANKAGHAEARGSAAEP
jgi:hypothetical protein